MMQFITVGMHKSHAHGWRQIVGMLVVEADAYYNAFSLIQLFTQRIITGCITTY
jgi:hypothetical protein